MNNKEIIQERLISIEDSNLFQKLCTDIIFYNYRQNLLSIEATGSQIGRNNTIRGVPDIYFYTKKEKYIFIEATIQKTDLKTKFIKDIEGCLKKIEDRQILIDTISSIWLMFSYRIGIDIEKQIRNKFEQFPFDIKFINIDDITNELVNAPFLIQDYLDISLNIGYVVPVNYFTDNYDKKINRLATPLDNPFYNREKELNEIRKEITNHDIIIIKGDVGVGKTKLAIEAINSFCNENLNYKSYVIGGYQSIDITNDLYNRILKEKNVILLIDDSNQKLNCLENILNVIYKNTTVNLKLVLTVRQYVFQEIISLLNRIEISSSTYMVTRFTNEELSKIISNEPFLIKDIEVQDQILKIAKGNPRLALMGAKAVNENQEAEPFFDTLSLYNQYFSRTIAELEKTTKEKTLIIILGLISTFNTIKLNVDDIETRKICEVFKLDFKELKETIEELEKNELLEIQYNRAKICEQITYTYFFYMLFIDKKILSFETLLDEFYQTYSGFISYLINAVTNTFSEQDFISKSLKKYYEKGQSRNDKKEELSNTLFSNHSDYLYDELSLELYNEIRSKPLNEISELLVYDKEYTLLNHFNHKKWNILLRTITNGDIDNNRFENSLILITEYIRRFSSFYNSLIYQIKTYKIPDYDKSFILFNFLIKDKDDLLLKSLFLEFASFFLKIFGKGKAEKYRIQTWETLFYYHKSERRKVEDIIIDYLRIPDNCFVEVLNNDLKILLPFIDSNYTPNDFCMTYWLNEYFNRLNKYNDIDKEKYRFLEDKYLTNEYKLYSILDWNKLNGKDEDSIELDYKEYAKVREKEILENISINNLEDFIPILESLRNSYLIDPSYSALEQTIRVILSDVLKRNIRLGIELINLITKEFPKIRYIVHLPINLMKTESDIIFLDKYIQNLDREHYIEVKSYFLWSIPTKYLSKKYADEFMELFNLCPSSSFQLAERFLAFEPNIFNSMINTIIFKKEKYLQIYESDIEKYISYITNTDDLITFYFQQKDIDLHFDESNKIFSQIFSRKREFLIDYIEYLNNKDSSEKHFLPSENLSKIWDDSNIESIINSLFTIYLEREEINIEILIKTNLLYIQKELFLPLFSKLENEKYTKALNFLILKLEQYGDSIIMVNLILFISRQMGDEVTKIILHKYLEYHTDIDSFKELELHSNSASIFGSGTFGDIYADRWKNTLEILEEYPNKFIVMPLIKYVKDIIEENLNQADSERERDYRGYR